MGAFHRIHSLEAVGESHPPGSIAVLEGVVITIPRRTRGDHYAYLIRTKKYKVKVLHKGEPPEPGDLIQAKGKVRRRCAYKNPGSPDFRMHTLYKGIAFSIYALKWDLLKARFLTQPYQTALDSRAKGLKVFIQDLGVTKGRVMASLVLGLKKFLNWNTRSLFIKSGLGHLLAVSGFHMGVVFFLLYALFRAILKTIALRTPEPYSLSLLPSRTALLLALICLAGYLLLTGFPVSAVRAFIMIACWVFARYIEKERSLEVALLMAFLIMTLYNPLFLMDVGFQLTFAAMLGVLLVLHLVEHLKGWAEYIAGYVLMAFVVPLSTLPFLFYHFHHFSPYAPIANMLFIMPAGFLVILGVLHLLLSPVPFMKAVVVMVEKALLTVFLGGLRMVSSLPHALLWVTTKEALCLSAFATTLLAALLLLKRWKTGILLLPLLSFFLLLLPSPRGILLLDLGAKGRSMLIQGDENVLVDGGTLHGRGAWSSLRDALLRRDIKGLDRLVVTRVVPSRASLVPKLLEMFRVEKLYLPQVSERKDLEDKILKNTRDKDVEIVRVNAPIQAGLISLAPRSSRILAAMLKDLDLEEGLKGWMKGGKLLKPWEDGAISFSQPGELRSP